MIWYFRFRWNAWKHGYRLMCLNCFTRLTGENESTLVVTPTIRATILCCHCNYWLMDAQKIKVYRRWFRRLSGLPSEMWATVRLAITDGDIGL